MVRTLAAGRVSTPDSGPVVALAGAYLQVAPGSADSNYNDCPPIGEAPMHHKILVPICALLLGCGACVDVEPSPTAATSTTQSSTVDAGSTTSEVSVAETEVDQDGEIDPEAPLFDARIPLPELSDEAIADNPLLEAMTIPADFAADPQASSFSPLIGLSRYLLVGDDGEPLEFGSGEFRQRSMNILAFHGSKRPVVYWMVFEPSEIYPELGYQSGCTVFAGHLDKSPGLNEYRIGSDVGFEVFDNRMAFGEFLNCDPDEVSLPEAFNGAFAIDVVGQESLTVTGADGVVANFAWTPVDE